MQTDRGRQNWRLCLSGRLVERSRRPLTHTQALTLPLIPPVPVLVNRHPHSLLFGLYFVHHRSLQLPLHFNTTVPSSIARALSTGSSVVKREAKGTFQGSERLTQRVSKPADRSSLSEATAEPSTQPLLGPYHNSTIPHSPRPSKPLPTLAPSHHPSVVDHHLLDFHRALHQQHLAQALHVPSLLFVGRRCDRIPSEGRRAQH